MLIAVFFCLLAMDQVGKINFTINDVHVVDAKLNYEITIENLGQEQITILKPQSFDDFHSIINIWLIDKVRKCTFSYSVTTIVNDPQAMTTGLLNTENLEINCQNTICLRPGERFVRKESLDLSEFAAVGGKNAAIVPSAYKLEIDLNYEFVRFAKQDFCNAPMFTGKAHIEEELQITPDQIKN